MRMLGMVSCLQAAPATADPVEGAKKDVPPSVLLLRCSARFPRTWQDLAAAQTVRDMAIRRLEAAQSRLETEQDALQFVWAQRKNAVANSAEAEKWETQVERAEEKVERAEEKVDRAMVEVKQAEEKVALAMVEVKQADEKVDRAKVEVKQAEEKVGRARAGGFCVLLAVAFDLHSRMVVVSVRSTVFCFLGSCSHLGKDPVVVKLSPLRSLGAFRSGGALGCFRFHKKCGCTCFTAWKRHLCGSGKGVTQI